jgi:hypothetical protein
MASSGQLTSSANRRSFLTRSAAIAAVPAVATLAGGALAEPASADTLPDYAPIPPSAAADVYTASTAFHILESIRLDLGFGSHVRP